MAAPAPGGQARSRRLLPVYAGVMAVGAITLLLVLPAGSNIRPFRQLSPLLTVNPPAAACLGPQLAVEQSGQFLELHVPGGGRLVAGGRGDRVHNVVGTTGHCAPGTVLAGQPFSARLQVAQQRTSEPEVTGVVLVPGQPPADLAFAAADPNLVVARATNRLAAGAIPGRVFLAVAVLIAVTSVVGIGFTFVGQPKVLGEIVAGVLLGPSLFGAVLPEANRYLFPGQVTDALQVMAQLGLIFFMFLVGLGVDLGQVRKLGHVAILISHASIIFPFSLGVLIALALFPVVGGGSFAGFALFMGAAMAITAFPVLARILTDTGIDRTPLGALAISCAAVDDVTAWCVLAIVVAVVKSSGAAHVLQVAGLTAVFTAGLILLLAPVLRRVAGYYQAKGRSHAPLVAILIALVLLAAWTTDSIGTHAIFGAFMLGIVVPRSPELIAEMTAKLESITAIVLLPIFFALVGLSTRVGLLRFAAQWWLLLLIMSAAVVGKWGGSAAAGRWAGLDWRETNALGILMNTRGLTEIVILSVGRGLGVVSPVLFTLMVLMALLTTSMTTPLVALFYPLRLRR